MSHQKNYFIVGNRFSAISNHVHILTYAELLTHIHDGKIGNARLNIEQGVSEEPVNWLRRFIKKYYPNNMLSIVSYFEKFERCSNLLSHKTLDYNTLISTPQEINHSHFYSVLMIDDRCSEMSDHVTGQHVQMMLLVEAARQMVLSVTEKFFIASDLRSTLSFVANGVESTFSQFIFPFFTEVHAHVLNQRVLAGNNMTNLIRVDFIQNQTVCAEIKFNSSVLEKNFLTEKENEMSMVCAEKYFLSLENEQYDVLKVVNNG